MVAFKHYEGVYKEPATIKAQLLHVSLFQCVCVCVPLVISLSVQWTMDDIKYL